MALTLLLHSEAEIELDSAVEYYEGREAGLGQRFYNAYVKTLKVIVAFPDSYPVSHKQYRKAKIRDFPYCILYRFYKETLIIVAVFHDKRNPQSWKDRI